MLLIIVWHSATFFTKAAKHIGILDLTGKLHKSAGQTTASDHLPQCKCSIDFDQFDTLYRKQIQTSY